MNSDAPTTGNLKLLPSECAEVFGRTDWTDTKLGPVEHWPAALKNSAQICLNSQFPMTLAWGEDLNVIYNDGYLAITGDKHPSIFGKPAREAYGEIWDGLLEEQAKQVLSKGEVIWGTNLLLPLRRNGFIKESYFTFCYSPVAGDDGRWTGVMSIATETTSEVIDARRSEHQRKLSSDFAETRSYTGAARAFAEAMSNTKLDCDRWALVSVNDDDRIVSILAEHNALPNQQHRNSADTYLDQPVAKVAASKDLFDARKFFDEPACDLVLLVAPDPLVSVDDRFMAHLGRLQRLLDVTCFRLNRDQDAVAERDNVYRLMFEYSTDATMFTSTGGEVFAANPAACELLGRSEAEICQIGRAGIMDLEDPRLEVALEERRITGYFTGELNITHKDGTKIPVDMMSAILPFANGDDRAMLIFRDARVRRDAAEQAQTSARLEAVGQLTGGVAHDFNNLLQVIIGSTDQLIQTLPDQSDERRYADLVLSASLKASDLTNQLLAFSRRRNISPQVTQLSSLIQEVDQILGRALGEQISVNIDLQDDHPVLIDNSLAQSAIINLALNAKAAMPGGGEITIGCLQASLNQEQAERLECQPGDYMKLFVTDPGSGIAPEDIDRVVEPFYTTKEKGTGTGLGLSMVFGFVRQSEGAIHIHSVPGEGTTVSLFFPLADEPFVAPKAAISEPEKGNQELIIVIEDNELVANSLNEILKACNYRVEHYQTGEEALSRIQARQDADLVISDIVLGAGIDGWSVAKQISQDHEALPIILISGYPGDHPLAERDASIPLLAKPFQTHEVLTLVAQALAPG